MIAAPSTLSAVKARAASRSRLCFSRGGPGTVENTDRLTEDHARCPTRRNRYAHTKNSAAGRIQFRALCIVFLHTSCALSAAVGTCAINRASQAEITLGEALIVHSGVATTSHNPRTSSGVSNTLTSIFHAPTSRHMSWVDLARYAKLTTKMPRMSTKHTDRSKSNLRRIASSSRKKFESVYAVFFAK